MENENERLTVVITKLVQNEELTHDEAIYLLNTLMSGGENEYRCVIRNFMIMLVDGIFNLNLNEREMPITINSFFVLIKEAIPGIEDRDDIYANNIISMITLDIYNIIADEISKYKNINNEVLDNINNKCVSGELKEEDAVELEELANNIFTRVKEEIILKDN